MFYDASVFDQNLCRWNKSSTSTKIEFCTGSSCGNCDLCTVIDVLGQTLFIPGAGACWRVQLATGGTLEGDFSDTSCSKDESIWQSTNGVFSHFKDVSLPDNTVVFIPGTNGYSGTFQFLEDLTVTKPSLEILNWNATAKGFVVQVEIPTCSTGAICPTMKIAL